MNQWIGLIGVIIGGLLGLSSNFIIKRIEREQKRKEKKISDLEEFHTNLYLLSEYFRKCLNEIPEIQYDRKRLDEKLNEINKLYARSRTISCLYNIEGADVILDLAHDITNEISIIELKWKIYIEEADLENEAKNNINNNEQSSNNLNKILKLLTMYNSGLPLFSKYMTENISKIT